MAKYTRFVLVQDKAYDIHGGQFNSVSHVLDTPDGTIWRVELHDEQFDALDTVSGVVFPSLNAPVARLPQAAQKFIGKRGLAPADGDTVLDLLRALRKQQGIDFKQLRIESEI